MGGGGAPEVGVGGEVFEGALHALAEEAEVALVEGGY